MRKTSLRAGHRRLRGLALLLASVAAAPLQAGDLPQGGRVVAGQATIGRGANRVEIAQSSANAILTWDSFGIGAGARVQFDNGHGATLNRVTGGDVSALMGRLDATGSVYLVNPAGVVIGSGGVVQTGGRFVASTLDVAQDDFLDGGALRFAGSGGTVVNLGRVGSSGGDVALIAGEVINRGSLTAPAGTVALAAGRQVVLRDTGVDDGLVSVVLGAGDVTEAGAIRAAAAELRARGGNVQALAGNTSGVIEATGVKREKGRIFLTAPGGKVTADTPLTGDAVRITGERIDLSALVAAHDITVKAEEETAFTGMLQSDGGFVELSGGHISYDGQIDAGGGTILIDPRNIEVSDVNGGLMSNATLFTPGDLERMLATGDVILDTSVGDTGDAGTILIASDVGWSSDSDLTLMAMGDIYIAADVQNEGAGDLAAVAGWDGETDWDPAVFAAAGIRSTLFGQVNGLSYQFAGLPAGTSFGSLYLFGGLYDVTGASFGSRSGSVLAYGNEVLLSGGLYSPGSTYDLSYTPYAQLGYHVTGGGDQGVVDSSITVRSHYLMMQGASGPNSYAMIGNGGNDTGVIASTSTADIGGDIRVEASDWIWLLGSQDPADEGAYAMIGHGSRDPFFNRAEGNRSGNIDISTFHLVLQEGVSAGSTATIGHVTSGGTISGADVTVTAQDLRPDAASGFDRSLVDIGMWADLTHGGTVRLTLNGANTEVDGSTAMIDAEADTMTSEHDFILQTAGTLTLGPDFFYGNEGAGGLVLAGDSVDNEAGAGAFIAGPWRVYSTRPDEDTGLLGTVTADFLSYGQSFDPSDPQGAQAALGNGLYYSVTPLATVDDGTMEYGDIILPTAAHLTVDGIEVDAAAFGLSVLPEIDNARLSLSGDGFVNAGVYADALYTSETFLGADTVLGYGHATADATVTQAVLTVTLGDVGLSYDGLAHGGAVSWQGFVGSDTESLISGLSFGYAGGDGSGTNAGSYLVSLVAASESSGNYTFDLTDTASLEIARATLGVSFADEIARTYDGTRRAVLTAADFVLTGFAAGEGATVLQGLGRFDSAHAGTREVTAALDDLGLWAFDAGTLAANYVLPESVSGDGRIDPARLVVSILGWPTKPADGTVTATLGASDYQVSGLVGRDAVTIGQGLGSYASAEAGNWEVTAALGAADYQALGTTDLANYVLDTEASGMGRIEAVETALPPEPEAPVTLVATTEDPEPAPPTLVSSVQVIDAQATGQILEQVTQGTNFCREFVDPEYAIDCLSDRLQSVASGLASTGDYAEVRAALEDAAAQLHALAVQNATAALSRSVADDGTGRRSNRPLTAVDPARLQDANAAAAAIIANTQLVLLRSVGNSDRRRVAYAQVGQVLGATTVLLRS